MIPLTIIAVSLTAAVCFQGWLLYRFTKDAERERAMLINRIQDPVAAVATSISEQQEDAIPPPLAYTLPYDDDQAFAEYVKNQGYGDN